jgi:hypothetical protein
MVHPSMVLSVCLSYMHPSGLFVGPTIDLNNALCPTVDVHDLAWWVALYMNCQRRRQAFLQASTGGHAQGVLRFEDCGRFGGL